MSEIDIAYSIVLASVILLLEIFGKEFEEWKLFIYGDRSEMPFQQTSYKYFKSWLFFWLWAKLELASIIAHTFANRAHSRNILT
jgi:hypothetical protein